MFAVWCPLGQDGNPVQRPEDVQDFLKRSHIDRVCSGHQPHGQTPTVVRHPRTGLLVITADTSRSDAKASKIFNPADNRGMVYSSVWLRRDSVEIEGPLGGRRPSSPEFCTGYRGWEIDSQYSQEGRSQPGLAPPF